ncbi:hypothetical protein ACH4VS_02400 [Streptomyces hygroscopicus]|uniref:hypothetical protein n=1 Tax=Streptomyces hygroscopicus TaxID=1912 RepID=UPI00117DCB3A|nr:hypothetical protein [Streptomyces hygroscopicus]
MTMSPDYQTQLAAFLALPDEELSRPLWEVPWNERRAFLAARTRRQFTRRSADDDFQMPEEHQRVTDWAETE